MRFRSVRTSLLIACGALVAVFAGLYVSAVQAEMESIRRVDALLSGQMAPNFSLDQQDQRARAYQDAMHPSWQDLSVSERVTRIAKIAQVVAFAVSPSSLPTAANFIGNRTSISATGAQAFILSRQSDCSLLMHAGTYGFSATAATALTLTPAGTTPGVERTLHDLAGLSTTAGTFAGGCNDARSPVGSRRTVYLGRTTNNKLVFAGVGYYPTAGSNVLWFGTPDTAGASMVSLKADASDPNINAVAAGDLNGDGMADIVGVDQLTPTISVWRVNTDGTLGPRTSYSLPGANAEGAVIADVNGDGKADVVVATQDASSHEQISVLTGRGDGTLNPTPQSFAVATPPGFSSHIETLIAVDLRGNGRKDIVASNGMVLLSNGDGTFATGVAGFPVVTATSSYGPNLVAGDFNRDGKADIAVSGGQRIAVYLGRGDGTFQAGNTYGSIDDVGYINATDIDGDGNLDLYLGLAGGGYFGGDQFDANQAYALMGKGDGSFQGAPGLPFVYTGTNLADINGDHIPDAIGVDSSLSLTSYIGDATGRFTRGSSIATTPVVISGASRTLSNIDSLAIGDVNGDGSADVVYVGVISDTTLFFSAGDGHGGLAAPVVIAQPSFVPAGDFDINEKLFNVRLADVNQDGKLDLVYGYSDTSYRTNTFMVGTAVQLGNGNGTFQSPQTIPFYSGTTVTFYTPRVAVIADMNRDGKPDLLFVNQTSQIDSTLATYAAHMQLALGRGDGTFAAAVDVAGPTIMTSAAQGTQYVPVTLADMNGDGIADIVALGASSSHNVQVAVSISNGDGTFRAPNLKTYSAQYLNALGLAVADFDGDGKNDVAITNPFSTYASGISYGNGDGTLQSTGDSSTTYTNANFVLNVGGATTALDLNRDGKPDLIAGTVELLSQAAATGGGGSGDFALSTSAAGGTVAAGASASVTVTLTPSGGFNQSVSLTCSGLPEGATCSFSPSSVSVGSGAATSTLTISTGARTVMNSGVPANPVLPAGTLLAALVVPLCIRRRGSRKLRVSGRRLVIALLALSTLGGCSGGSGSAGGGTGTPAGTSTVTITATAGTIVHTTTYTLTVN